MYTNCDEATIILKYCLACETSLCWWSAGKNPSWCESLITMELMVKITSKTKIIDKNVLKQRYDTFNFG